MGRTTRRSGLRGRTRERTWLAKLPTRARLSVLGVTNTAPFFLYACFTIARAQIGLSWARYGALMTCSLPNRPERSMGKHAPCDHTHNRTIDRVQTNP